ncbi:hypothetical protein ACFL0D_06170 [Thermoproteota archaeon]
MVGYNQRKLKILSLGLEGYPLSSSIVAEVLDISLENASTCLKMYYRLGLFTRDWVEGCYEYYLTEQGEDRFWYILNEQRCTVEVEEDDDEINAFDWNLLGLRRCPVDRSNN